MSRASTIVSGCMITLFVSACTMSTTATPPTARTTISPLFSPAVHNRIAIYVKDETRRCSAGGIRRVEDEFMRAVIAKGYTLAARSDLEQVLREQDLQASRFTEQAIARKARALGVSAVLLVSINELTIERYQPFLQSGNQRYYAATADISARLISAELAQVVMVASYSGATTTHNQSDREAALSRVASVVANGLPSRHKAPSPANYAEFHSSHASSSNLTHLVQNIPDADLFVDRIGDRPYAAKHVWAAILNLLQSQGDKIEMMDEQRGTIVTKLIRDGIPGFPSYHRYIIQIAAKDSSSTTVCYRYIRYWGDVSESQLYGETPLRPESNQTFLAKKHREFERRMDRELQKL